MIVIERRRFLVAASALVVAPLVAQAQREKRTVRVAAILTTSPVAEMAGPDPQHPMIGAFVREQIGRASCRERV